MRVLICRSREENLILKQCLQEQGFDVLALEGVKYSILKADFQEYRSHRIVVVTSKFAAKILSHYINYHIKCFVVGHESANILSSNANIAISNIYPSVEDLISDLPHLNESIIYYSGNVISKDIPYARRIIIYNTCYLHGLTENEIEQVKLKQIDVIFLHSKKVAEHLFSALKASDLLSLIRKSVVIGISEKVLAPFIGFCAAYEHSKHYSQDEMIKTLLSYKAMCHV